MKTVQIHFDESMQEHLMWFLKNLPSVVVEEKASVKKTKKSVVDELAGCFSEYTKGKEGISIKEAREIAWDAEMKEKYGSGRH